MVEFALILPVFLLHPRRSDRVRRRSTARSSRCARAFARPAGRGRSRTSVRSCQLGCPVSASGTTPNIQKLICLAKSQAGVGDSVRVRVKFADADLTPTPRMPRATRLAMRSSSARSTQFSRSPGSSSRFFRDREGREDQGRIQDRKAVRQRRSRRVRGRRACPARAGLGFLVQANPVVVELRRRVFPPSRTASPGPGLWYSSRVFASNSWRRTS